VIRKALIPAAGRGVRAYPKTEYQSKVMLEIDGTPLVERNITVLRDQMDIRDITLVVGYRADQIRERLGDGSRFGVSLTYVDCPDVSVGLAQGMALAQDSFREPFVTILGDELYLDSNHNELQSICQQPFDAVCAVMRTLNHEQIRRNYTVQLADDVITSLVEKPSATESGILGCGTYAFTPAIWDAIAATAPSPRTGRVELTDAINTLASSAGRVIPFWLTGKYFNVNSVDEYNYAQYVVRAARFPTCRVSVVIPAYNEEASIAYVVRDFRERVDEVLVVDNSSADRTAECAAEAGARVETVSLTGYGDTIRWGLDHAVGDIIVVVEADYSFRARDLGKMLEYLKDAGMVVGTRTTRELVEQGTNMRGPVRWGNIFVAKTVEALWWGQQPRFTDVGCTYRALWRDTYRRIRPYLTGVGPELSPEMMIAVLQTRQRVIEVPVSYHRRVGGESKHSANYWHIARTATRMLRTIAYKRLTGR